MYRFMLCSLKTGKTLYTLPFEINGSLTRLLQGFGAGSLSLPVLDPACSDTWEQDVLPWRSLILVLDEHNNILWHGIPTNRVRNKGPKVGFPCVTIEGYLLRRYVPNMTFEAVEQIDIAKALAGVAGDAVGIPIEFNTKPSGILRDRTQYEDADNARVYNRLQELAAVEKGFDWTIDVVWADADHTRVKYVFRTGYPHLGNRTPTPEHIFEMPGNVTDFDFEERRGEGDGATLVRAVGEGDSEFKVMSDPVINEVLEDAGYPRTEERRSFSGVSRKNTIQAHAEKLGEQLFGGQDIVTLTVKNDAGTSLGELTSGDTARVKIKTDTTDLDEVWVVTEWSLDANSSEYKPTLTRLEP